MTGANRGIGFKIVRGLLSCGFDVFLGCRVQSRGEAARTELIRQTGGDGIDRRIHVLAVDLDDPQSILTAKAVVQSVAGSLDVLIHNAAFITYDPIGIESVERSLAVNYDGTILVNEAFFPLVRSGGRVIFVSSAVGKSILGSAADANRAFE